MKDKFKKVLLMFTLCFMILPVSVYASESKEVEKDFPIEVSKDEVVKDNSFTIDVVEDKKDNNKKTNQKSKYSPFTSEWNVEGKSVDRNNDLANLTYGTSRVSAYKLIEDCLNLRDTKVWDQIINEDGSKTSVLNKKKTINTNGMMNIQ